MEIPRVSAEAVRRKMTSGSSLLLVCGYDDLERFRAMELEGAISWTELEGRLRRTASDREIVFYCG